jgi:Mn2+/Fe2+ NRAMP family transporter
MSEADVPAERPPRRFSGLAGLLTLIGPGIVVAGSVIGSGEVINTPLQAATFGFTLLWAVILSCFIKVFLQLEIGRYCLVYRRPTIEALSDCPGPRVRGVSWLPLAYMAAYTISLLPAVGIVGGLAGLVQAVAPIGSEAPAGARIWAVLIILATALLLRTGIYGQLERLVALLVGGFCVSVFIALALIQGTDYQITTSDLVSGLTGSLGANPRAGAYAVISLMGALGTTANELFMYPYWVLEKGYGSDVPAERNEVWLARIKPWIRGLHLDVAFATVVAAAVTVAFYLLGAAILYRQNVHPHGLAVVEQISAVFTSSYGRWSYAVYIAGAFCALYSTLIVVTAATARMWADLLGAMRLIDRRDGHVVNKTHRILQWICLAGMLAAFLAINEAPARLVIFGQFFSAVINMPLMMFGICWLAFHTDPRVRMSRWAAVALVISVAVLTACTVVGLLIQLGWITNV